MKIKTSELIGPALDWAVAKAEGERVLKHITFNHESTHPLVIGGVQVYAPSITPSLGLEIIERELICLDAGDGSYPEPQRWSAWLARNAPVLHASEECTGPTALIAAMRAYVLHKLGDEVEVPDELA